MSVAKQQLRVCAKGYMSLDVARVAVLCRFDTRCQNVGITTDETLDPYHRIPSWTEKEERGCEIVIATLTSNSEHRGYDPGLVEEVCVPPRNAILTVVKD